MLMRPCRYVPDPRGAPTKSTYIDYAGGNPGAVKAFVGYTDGEVSDEGRG